MSVQAPAKTAQSKTAGRKPGTPSRTYDLTGLELETISAPRPVSPEVAAKLSPANSRSPQQSAMDAVVAGKYEEWKTAGSPTDWRAMPKAMYAVEPRLAEGLKYLVRRAADFHKVAVRFGRTGHDAEGRELVVFAVRARRPKSVK